MRAPTAHDSSCTVFRAGEAASEVLLTRSRYIHHCGDHSMTRSEDELRLLVLVDRPERPSDLERQWLPRDVDV